MTEIRLQNPYVDETIKVKENFGQMLQSEPEERLITINPKHFAKIDFKIEEVQDDSKI